MNIEQFKVSTETDSFKLAKSITSVLLEKHEVDKVEINAMGSRAVYNAIKALALTAEKLKRHGFDNYKIEPYYKFQRDSSGSERAVIILSICLF